ncbi:hypothetical protein W02_24560 [Nitrospira sp. KM1]|uniref:hypothetical protein n=1 Tax=Nitrospira sp. KM1 TaxID=1936990 RepID=UPI0013A7A7D6|nr:hypothetical protein [Nitrospira sp. KM1]BCA55316.1 hypothetical protein W02_24560 [Nitrospira sp. KM1]
MQHMSVESQTESGEVIERFNGETGFDGSLVYRFPEQEGCCIRFIDWYGHTVFNHLQLPILIAEFEKLKSSLPEDLHGHLNDLIAFIARAHARSETNDGGTYIRFIGKMTVE